MLRRILEWLVGRKEPTVHHSERDARLRILNARLEVLTRGKR